MTEDTRKTRATMKVVVNIAVVVLVALALMLFNLFVLDDITGGMQKDAKYWVIKIITGVATLLLMFSTANITEESLKRRNRDYFARLVSLDDHYQKIMQNGENEQIEQYLQNLNIKAKYLAHIKRFKLLLAHSNSKKRREKYEQYLLMSPQEVWALERPRVRYNKITWSDLAAGAMSVDENCEDNDLHLHRVREGIKKVVWKALFIVGAGCYIPDFVYHFSEFSTAMIMPLILRFIVILFAVYSGITFGYQMMERLLLVLKRKLKIFSDFRHRTDSVDIVSDLKYKVSIENDRFVEKIRAKYSS